MFCHSCDLEIKHSLYDCPFCAGPLSTEPAPQKQPSTDLVRPESANVITFITAEDESAAASKSGVAVITEEPPEASEPTAFVSFGKLESEDEPAKAPVKRRWRKPVAIAAASVAAVAIIAFLAVSLTRVELSKSITALSAEIKERTDASVFAVFEPLSGCLENGEISADISYTDEYGDTVSGIISYASSSDIAAHALSLKAELYGYPMKADMFVNGDHLALGSPLLGDVYYGVRFDSFDKDFATFTELNRITGANADEYSEIVSAIDHIFNGDKMLALPEETSNELNRILVSFFLSLSKTETREQIGSNSVKSSVITYIITVDDITGLGRELLDFARTDENIRSYLTAYLQYTGEYDYYEYDNYAFEETVVPAPAYEPISYRLQNGGIEPVDMFLDEFEEILEVLEKYCEGDISIRLISTSGRFCAMELSSTLYLEGEALRLELALDFGQNVYDEWVFTCYFETTNDYYELSMVWSYAEHVGINTNRITVSVNDGYSDYSLSVKSEWDEVTNRFLLSFGDSSRFVLSLGGTLVYSKEKFVLKLDTMPELSLQVSGYQSCVLQQPDFVNLDEWDTGTLELFAGAIRGLYAGIYSYPVESPARDSDTLITIR